jgi:predicted AAA+ superfamily ATPase
MLTPLNFREFLGAKKISIENWKMDLKKQAEIRSLFKDYLVNGGFPKHVLTGENIIIKELYEQILYRDIIERFSKSRTKVIKEISVSLLSNPSSLVSMRQISATTHIKNLGSVKSILDAFESSFLFFFVNKFDFSVKKQTQNPRKVYCIDNGFPVALGFRLSDDMGKLIENLTAVELKRKGKEVFYHSDKNECDFVIREGNKITEAIQVCYNLTEDNKGRETKGLIEVMERFKLKEGLILTYDQTDEFKIGTIRIKVLPVWKWLLDDKKFD